MNTLCWFLTTRFLTNYIYDTMILSEKRYTPEEYDELASELLLCPNMDEELQFAQTYVLNLNPRFFLLMFQGIQRLKEAANLSENKNLASNIDLLNSRFADFERKLNEMTNIIPANLPDSILGDTDLVEIYLADFYKKTVNEELFSDFQTIIEGKRRTIPQKLEMPFLKWCFEMLSHNYKKHKKGCTNPTSCPINQGYDRRILYITRLIEEATALQIEAFPIQIEPKRVPGNKIQWLGSQKELAELFIRLKAKGWITEFEPETIKDCFTNANSIQQYLKPGEYTEDLGGTFEQVFTQEYSAKFHGMILNPKRT